MRIAISTVIFDLTGALCLDLPAGAVNLGEWRRRVSRTATLDGGAVVVDGGFSDADRTLSVDLTDQTEADVNAWKAICKHHARVLLFLPDGAYGAVPENVAHSGSAVSARLLVVGPATVSHD